MSDNIASDDIQDIIDIVEDTVYVVKARCPKCDSVTYISTELFGVKELDEGYYCPVANIQCKHCNLPFTAVQPETI